MRVVALAGLALALVVIAAGELAGCGPIVYVSEVSRRASASVDAARTAHADQYAPYWWTRATQYLEKAREVAAHADFQGANRFGRLAAEAADKATEEALIAARDPSRRPLGPSTGVVPAKDPTPTTTPSPPPSSPPPSSATPARGPTAPARTAPAKESAPKRIAPVPAKDAP